MQAALGQTALSSEATAMLQSLMQQLSAVAHTPALRVPHVVSRQKVEELLQTAVAHPQLRQAMMEVFGSMLQGMHSFRVLQGALRAMDRSAFFAAPRPPRASAPTTTSLQRDPQITTLSDAA